MTYSIVGNLVAIRKPPTQLRSVLGSQISSLIDKFDHQPDFHYIISLSDKHRPARLKRALEGGVTYIQYALLLHLLKTNKTLTGIIDPQLLRSQLGIKCDFVNPHTSSMIASLLKVNYKLKYQFKKFLDQLNSHENGPHHSRHGKSIPCSYAKLNSKTHRQQFDYWSNFPSTHTVIKGVYKVYDNFNGWDFYYSKKYALQYAQEVDRTRLKTLNSWFNIRKKELISLTDINAILHD